LEKKFCYAPKGNCPWVVASLALSAVRGVADLVVDGRPYLALAVIIRIVGRIRLNAFRAKPDPMA